MIGETINFSDPGLIISTCGTVVSVIGLLITLISPISRKARNITLIITAGFILSTVFFLWRPAMSPAATTTQAQDHFELGLQHYQAGRFAQAIEEFEKFTEEQRQKDESKEVKEKVTEAYYYIGSSHLKLSTPNCEGAFRLITQIQRHNSSDSHLDMLFQECRKAKCPQCEKTDIR